MAVDKEEVVMIMMIMMKLVGGLFADALLL